MDKMTAGLLGAVAGLAAMGTAQAALAPGSNPTEALHAASYADLLAPVPDAVAAMQADDALRTQQPKTDPNVELAEGYYYNPGYAPAYHHHHHHHHHHHQAYYHHHHHHHSAYVGVPGVGVVIGEH